MKKLNNISQKPPAIKTRDKRKINRDEIEKIASKVRKILEKEEKIRRENFDENIFSTRNIAGC